MLTLIERRLDNHAAQNRIEARLTAGLTSLGEQPISFRPQIVNLPMYGGGLGNLWWATQAPSDDQDTPRFWNAFGLYKPGKPQRIAVEINIPSDYPSASVGGFFASDTETGKVLLMHSGKVGGGLTGATKAGFLEWLNRPPMEVVCRDQWTRTGIVISSIDSEHFVHDLSVFVRASAAFKESLSK